MKEEYILEKYSYHTISKDLYYKPMKELIKNLKEISPRESYIVYINSNIDEDIRNDIKTISKINKVRTKEVYFLPENIIACIIDKDKLFDKRGVLDE